MIHDNTTKGSSSKFGERIGAGSRNVLNKTVYFLIGVCFIGVLSSVYFFFQGFKNGWTKTGKIKK